MMNIKQFVFNPFGVNCYIISNDAGDAILIDPSVSNTREQTALADPLPPPRSISSARPSTRRARNSANSLTKATTLKFQKSNCK